MHLAKAQKNPVELEGAVDAQRRDGAAVARFLAWLDAQPLDGSLDEEGAAARLEQERAKDPLFRGPSFDTISAHGPNAALPHYRATPESNRPLTGGTLYLVDSGGQYLDATTDITRTVALGTRERGDARALHARAQGHDRDLARGLPGRHHRRPDRRLGARGPLAPRSRLRPRHRPRRGLVSVRPRGPGADQQARHVPLKPGMILSNEPGYYKPDAYGIRIENLVAVEPRRKPEGGDRELLGFRTLTLCPIDRRLIVPALLTAEERSWLDAYHARVREELRPLVGEAAGWLDEATAPLA